MLTDFTPKKRKEEEEEEILFNYMQMIVFEAIPCVMSALRMKEKPLHLGHCGKPN